MKITALLVAGLLSAPAVHAQVAKAPETPKASCPCDNPNFKPLTDKARAVEAYWDARRKVKVATVISGTGAIFSLLSQNLNGMRESTDSYDRARSAMWSAKAKAESLGALKVTGDDMDGTIELKLVKGVDYTL